MPASVASDNISSVSLSSHTKIFLTLLESVRDLFARRLVYECNEIREHDLNYTILTTILQVIFLRTGQDCGFTEPDTLSLLAESDGISRRMARACSDAGLSPDILFENTPDSSRTTSLVPDDVLRDVIRCMDSERIPLPLSTIPIENLAVVFEHFLGTRMYVAEGYRVKRAGKSALLYTGSVGIPLQVLVDYMVSKTVSDAIREQETCCGTGIRIVDPACGAGIFLLAAYRFLVRGKNGYSYRPEQGQELLHDLACQSIYGTDIDPEYVCSARFVLLLSFIDEWRLSGRGHVSPGHMREICKCLKGTIRCGNALISKDYFSGLQEHPFNEEERRKVNVFSWQEAFPHVLESGGFDAVIGAPPPYQPFNVKARDEYFQMHYDVYAKDAGLYGYFIEKGLKILRSKGSLSFCIPGTFLRTNHARPLRKLLLAKQIEEIVDFGDLPDFRTGPTYPCIIRVSNNKPAKEFYVSKVETLDFPSLDGYVNEHRHPIDQHTLTDGGWTLTDKRMKNLLKKLQNVGSPLEEYVMGGLHRGITTGLNDAFVINEKIKNQLIYADPGSATIIKPFLTGKDIKRYIPPEKGKNVILMPKGWTNIRSGAAKNKGKWFKENYPAISQYLEPFKKAAEVRYDKGDYWWELRACEYYEEFEKPKIFYPDIAQRGCFTFDETGKFFCAQSGYFIVSNQKYLLGLLNSKLITFYYSKITAPIHGGYMRFFTQDIAKLPIYTIDFDNPNDKTRHDRMVMLVTEMLELHKHLRQAKTDQEKLIITREIESTDRQLDSLVYGLYGLSVDEIAVVEECISK